MASYSWSAICKNETDFLLTKQLIWQTDAACPDGSALSCSLWLELHFPLSCVRRRCWNSRKSKFINRFNQSTHHKFFISTNNRNEHKERKTGLISKGKKLNIFATYLSQVMRSTKILTSSLSVFYVGWNSQLSEPGATNQLLDAILNVGLVGNFLTFHAVLASSLAQLLHFIILWLTFKHHFEAGGFRGDNFRDKCSLSRYLEMIFRHSLFSPPPMNRSKKYFFM